MAARLISFVILALAVSRETVPQSTPFDSVVVPARAQGTHRVRITPSGDVHVLSTSAASIWVAGYHRIPSEDAGLLASALAQLGPIDPKGHGVASEEGCRDWINHSGSISFEVFRGDSSTIVSHYSGCLIYRDPRAHARGKTLDSLGVWLHDVASAKHSRRERLRVQPAVEPTITLLSVEFEVEIRGRIFPTALNTDGSEKEGDRRITRVAISSDGSARYELRDRDSVRVVTDSVGRQALAYLQEQLAYYDYFNLPEHSKDSQCKNTDPPYNRTRATVRDATRTHIVELSMHCIVTGLAKQEQDVSWVLSSIRGVTGIYRLFGR